MTELKVFKSSAIPLFLQYLCVCLFLQSTIPYTGCPNGRQIQDPIRILAELIEDANVTKKELHIFSADLSKAFDTLEYWSQAMSWRALGAPKNMVNMLVDMDRGGSTVHTHILLK